VLLTLAEAGPSKVPFYIAGGVLVLWAIVISAIGISRPDFPGKELAGRLVMGISALLVAGAMVTAVATS